MSTYRCPACGDVHEDHERENDDGSLVCPECGEKTAFVMDTGERPP